MAPARPRHEFGGLGFVLVGVRLFPGLDGGILVGGLFDGAGVVEVFAGFEILGGLRGEVVFDALRRFGRRFGDGFVLGGFGDLRLGRLGARGRRPVAVDLGVGDPGISPVNSATVTASLLPRRRRRRPPTGGAPIVPLRASNSATEIGRVLVCSSGPVIVCCLWALLSRPLAPPHLRPQA